MQKWKNVLLHVAKCFFMYALYLFFVMVSIALLLCTVYMSDFLFGFYLVIWY